VLAHVNPRGERTGALSGALGGEVSSVSRFAMLKGLECCGA
jgi:hypothetical protein